VVKKQEAFATVGNKVYWDSTGDPYGGSAGTGAATATAASNSFIGFVVKVAGADDEVVQLLLRTSIAVSAEQLALADLSDVGATLYTAGRILIGDGDSYEDQAVTGDITIDGAGAVTIAEGAVDAAMVEALADGEIIIGVDGTAANNAKVTVTGDVVIAKTGVATIQEGAVDAAMVEALASGQIIVGVDGTAANNAKVTVTGDITMANDGVTTLNAAHNELLVIIPVEDLAAGADLTDVEIFVHPRACTVKSIGILTQGAAVDVDDANTVVIVLADDADNTIVTKTYDTAGQPPSSDYADLGTLDVTHKILTAAEHVTLTVTQGATADMPAFSVVMVVEPTNA